MDRMYLILFLLWNKYGNGTLSTKSVWKSYIDLLPESVDLPVCWNESEMKMLDGLTLQHGVESKLGKLKMEFDCLASVFEDLFTFDQFKWAYSIYWYIIYISFRI
jgi:hypothetical protein